MHSLLQPVIGNLTLTFAIVGSLTISARGEIDEELAASPPVNEEKRSFHDPLDGCFDLSEFIKEPLGFVPVVMPITEPAVGYGAGGALVFISPNEPTSSGQYVRPNLTLLGGMATENGTRGYFGMHIGSWFEDKLQTRVAVYDVSANLDFYSIGDIDLNGDVGYNLDTRGIFLEGMYRVGDSKWMLGGSYDYSETKAKFDIPNLPGLSQLEKRNNFGGLSVIVDYDSRNNFFTPTGGVNFETKYTFFDPALGSDDEFQLLDLTLMNHHQWCDKWTFSLLASYQESFGDAPFYRQPYVSLRGVPMRKYQANRVAFSEAELRWQFLDRWSLLGFAGIGVTNDTNGLRENTDDVVAGGFGFRYLIAREVGLHMGADLAFSEETTAFYIQFGNAWMKE